MLWAKGFPEVAAIVKLKKTRRARGEFLFVGYLGELSVISVPLADSHIQHHDKMEQRVW